MCIRDRSHDDRVLFQAVARVVLDDERGTLTEQLEERSGLEPLVPALAPTRTARPDSSLPLPARELIFPNGLGGFTRDGHEYVITLGVGQTTPAPWVNVLANPTFGTLVSESGAAYSWVENSHEFRLTPWSNDPVMDTTGEAIYPVSYTHLPGARRSWFTRLFAGDAGIDPYTREVSDVYQDVFQEGSFIGKGIYDVDAFGRAMHGRFPENTVLLSLIHI